MSNNHTEIKGIGIVGKAHSGKTYLANKLKHYLEKNKPVQMYKFADPLYSYLAYLKQNKKREFMIQLSDITKKYYGNDVFIRCMEKRIDESSNTNCYIIIDDVRYIQEYNLLKNRNFYIIYLDIPEEIRKKRCQLAGLEWIPTHSSETELEALKDKCDWIINEVIKYDYDVFPEQIKKMIDTYTK